MSEINTKKINMNGLDYLHLQINLLRVEEQLFIYGLKLMN